MTFNETSNEKTPIGEMLLPSAISSVFGSVIAIISILIFAALLSFSDISEGLIEIFGYLSIIFGGLASGILSAVKHRKNGLVVGLISGLIMFFVLFIFRAIFAGIDSFSIKTLIQLIIIVVFSMLGGVFGVNLKRKRK